MENVTREEVPARRGKEAEEEELLATYATAITHTGVYLLMEGVEERTGDKVRGPDHRRRVHQETAGNASDREPNLRGGSSVTRDDSPRENLPAA